MMIVCVSLVTKWIPPQYRRVSAMANIGSKTEWEFNTKPRWRLKDGGFRIPFTETENGKIRASLTEKVTLSCQSNSK